MSGMIIADASNNLLASVEIQYVNGMPSKILYMWYEENKAVQFQFDGIETNVPIDTSKWLLPTYDDQVNLADQIIY